MNSQAMKSVGWAFLLVILGMAALYGGPKWLAILIPGALLVWFAAGPKLRRHRN